MQAAERPGVYAWRLISLILAAFLAQACSVPPDRPNVLLVIVDTLRPDFLGAYGFPLPTSPNVDALASRGVVFDNAIAASSRTAPSHASIMTSKWVREHSIGFHNGDSRLEGEVTLAMALQRAGYDTAAFVSNIILQRRIGLDAGFEVYDDDLPDAELNRRFIFERTAPETTERALAWLASRDAQRPWFLWVHYQDPHGPYTPSAPDDADFPELLEGDAAHRVLPVLQDNSGHGGIPAYQAIPGENLVGQYRRRYAGEIRHFDRQLGRLLTKVREKQRPTIIVFTADHGESMGESGYFFAHGHATTPDLVHIPLILVVPGIAPGRRSGLVHHVDVLPTVLDLVGVDLPPGVRGISLAGVLRDEKRLPDRVVFSDIGSELSAYRGNHFARVQFGLQSRSVNYFSRNPGGGWAPGGVDVAMRDALVTYLAIKQRIVAAPGKVDDATRKRLRALGYLEPKQ